jgi:hypothetical protein
MSLTIAELQLRPIMERRARELDLAFPGLITYVSGRRSIHDQAHAMAVNHQLDPNHYLASEYFRAAEFLSALVANPDADTIEEITEVFYRLMVENPTFVMSPHLLGNAVDPLRMEENDGTPTPDGAKVIEWIKACPDTVDFFMREGHLRRWHWSCRDSLEGVK